MTLGTELREAREGRGLSLRELSERTKIRLSVLRAIENDDFQHVPGSVIMRGFLKLYAREVGLDPDAIGRRYTEQRDWPEEGHGTGTGNRAGTAAGWHGWRPAVLPLAGLLLVLAGVGLWRAASGPAAALGGPVPSRAPSPGGEGPAAAPADNRVAPGTGTSGTAQPAPGGNAASRELDVSLRATAEVWVAATVDGKQVAFRSLEAGENLAFRVSREAVLRLGVPGNVELVINGQSARPFERPGTPTTLRITPDTYRGLLP